MPHYHTTETLLTTLAALTCNTVSDYATHVVNQTEDGRDLVAVTINAAEPTKSAAEDKLRIMFTFGIHGREYLPSEISANLIQTLCDDSDRSRAILANTAFAIMPVLNPSGRGRTDECALDADKRTLSLGSVDCNDRRKNANRIDLNRNFDIEWDNDLGSSTRIIDDDYRGTAAASEVETNTLAQLASSWEPDMYIDVHTGTLAMYRPWNYVLEEPADSEAAKNMSDFLESLKTAEWDDGRSIFNGTDAGVDWRVPDAGIGANISYIATGTAADWMYMYSPNIKYTFIVETFEEPATIWRIISASEQGGDLRRPRGGGSSLSPEEVERWKNMTNIVPDRRARDYAVFDRQVDSSDERRRAQKQLQQQGSQAKAGALQPATEHSSSGDTNPSDWENDSCFKYFNPITEGSLTHWTTAWTEVLLRASERLASDMGVATAADGSSGAKAKASSRR